MAQLIDFGIVVKKRLIDLNRNQNWLIGEVKKTGSYIDHSYLNRLMTGKATSAPMVNTIKGILGIEENEE